MVFHRSNRLLVLLLINGVSVDLILAAGENVRSIVWLIYYDELDDVQY